MKFKKITLFLIPLLMLTSCGLSDADISFNSDDYAIIHIFQVSFDENPEVIGEFGYYYLEKGNSLPYDVGLLYGYEDKNSLTPPTYSVIEFFTSIDPLISYDKSQIYENMDIYMRYK